jgi:hypothetical protein
MQVDPITPISDTSQVTANQVLEEYLAKKKVTEDEQADKSAKMQVAKDVQEAKNRKKIEDAKFLEAKLLKADQAEKYQIKKESNKQELEAKNERMDAVTNANARHFHAEEVNSKAAQDKANAIIEQNTVALEDFLAAKTSTEEVNRRADNAAATLYSANSNILNSKSETEHAVESYQDNMATQSTLQTTNATETTRLTETVIPPIRQNRSSPPHINILD